MCAWFRPFLKRCLPIGLISDSGARHMTLRRASDRDCPRPDTCVHLRGDIAAERGFNHFRIGLVTVTRKLDVPRVRHSGRSSLNVIVASPSRPPVYHEATSFVSASNPTHVQMSAARLGAAFPVGTFFCLAIAGSVESPSISRIRECIKLRARCVSLISIPTTSPSAPALIKSKRLAK
jgi:hypothetical protein